MVVMSDVEYTEIPIPDDKARSEYNYNERRAEILKMIEEKGHPWGFNYSQLGREYGVSHETIRKDFKRLKKYYRNRVGDEAKATSELAYRRIVKGHMDNDEFDKARKALDSWNEWLQDTGHQEKEPEKVDVGGEGIVFNFSEPDED